ncbi:MAG: flagellar biosynthesis anti-sigma factor FlgM [Lachnospiraceae bacterium]|nr:flagellar biosynthesis anti-sigma factor FlgM [Lachnospiraceae bacterium]
MNVIFQTMNNTPYRTPVSAPRKRAAQPAAIKGDYDTVNIQRARVSQDDDESFARILARKTAAQLGSGASAERVQDLGCRIADGTYQPDAQRIAGRMLGLG